MLIRFYEVTTNTVGGVYRKEDFINPATGLFWKTTDANRPSTLVLQGEYNFDATDNISELVIEVNTPLLYYPNRITHIVAETNQVTTSANSIRYVAYSVDSVEFMGFSQVKFLLVEDPVISHMTQLFDSNMLINRTNDYSKFMSHDISDLAYTRERTTVDFGVNDYTGKWIVYTLAININDYDSLYVNFRNLEHKNYEKFSALTDVLVKYPEVYTKAPTSIDYFGKIVSTGSAMYQAQFIYSLLKIEWREVSATKLYYDTNANFPFHKNQPPMNQWIGPSVKLTTGDMLTVNIAFPVADNVMAYGVVEYENNAPIYGWRSIPCADRVNTIKIGGTLASSSDMSAFIISKRVVTGLAFNEQGKYRPSSAVGNLIYTNNPNLNVIGNTLSVNGIVATCITYLTNISNTMLLNFSLSGALEYEPFRKYYLNVFGQNIPIKSKLQGSNIYIKSLVSSADWSITVYSQNTNNVIWSGKINADMPYSLDKFQDFLAQNSTYTASKWVNTMLGGGSRLGKSAITGLLSGNLGAGALSVGTGIASLGQDITNMLLQEKSMKDAPDTIKGDGNDFGTIAINPYGIYFYYMSPTTDALNIMKTELYANGFQTSYVGKINSIAWTANDIYGSCKLVKGRLVGMMHNYHITNLLNSILEKGIVILTP